MIIDTKIGRITDPVERFFSFCQERDAVCQRRAAGLLKPWTEDVIIQQFKFTNVFREYDRTTLWFAKYVREPLKDKPEVLLATVLFRWFNRITTGEAIFCQQELFGGPTAWDDFLKTGDTGVLRSAILKHCGDGPYVTGAYIIQTRGAPTGSTKLDGVLHLVGLFNKRNWRSYEARTLEHTSRWLEESPSMGPFMAYEVVTDLRWTFLLEKAPDIESWANPGPGATRGLNRARERDLGAHPPVPQQIQEMQKLLWISRHDPRRWPADLPRWEMREVEHSLCEWDKYERVRTGQGRPRGLYK